MARNTIARISLDALRHNLRVIRRRCPGSRLMAVVKADAYGHRLSRCLPALMAADMLAVATLDEARKIRRLGNGLPVLLLEGVHDPLDLHRVAELRLELVVHDMTQLQMLEAAARPLAPRIWLKLDSGMHRLGFPLSAAAELHARLARLPGVEQVNLMSHFACADERDHPLNAAQLARFDQGVTALPGEHSLANSAAILHWPEAHRDWVRAGILIYGISPIAHTVAGDFDLRPVMTLSSELIAINHVAAGEAIGYGARSRAAQDLRIGVAGIGYGDGYPRSLPDGTPVRVAGWPGKLIGRVSMDMITIDLSDCPQARVGDEVVLWGEGLPIETVAAAAGTIPYELVCRITGRVRFENELEKSV